MMLQKIHQNRILIGAFLWLVWLFFMRPNPLDLMWGRAILLLAPFVIVPMATDVLTRSASVFASQYLGKVIRWQLPAAVVFAVAFSLPNSWWSMVCALPWVGVTFVVAGVGLQQIWRGAWQDGASFAISAGMAYLSVAGIWAVLERLGFYPFNFNPEIVFLTIVHFHYAGFVLPILAGLAARNLGGIFNQIACYFTVAAVGLLALGITFTQLGIGHAWELISAWLMALSAATVATMHLRLAFNKNNSLKIRFLWSMATVALLGGMLLAGLYGGRFLAPIPWLDIPMMRALHGTLNAVGFGLCAVLGWWVKHTTNPSD